MGNSEITISGKTFVIALLFMLGIAAAVYVLNEYDNGRKEKTVEALYNGVLQATYLDSLEAIVNRIDSNSVDITFDIRETLKTITIDVEKADRCTLYVKRNSSFIMFTDFGYYKRGHRKKGIYAEDKNLYLGVQESSNKLGKLQEMNKALRHVKVCYVLEDDNNEYSFLIVTHYRG